jgi:hypothetical protein
MFEKKMTGKVVVGVNLESFADYEDFQFSFFLQPNLGEH